MLHPGSSTLTLLTLEFYSTYDSEKEHELDGIHWEISVLQSMRSTFSVSQKRHLTGKSDFMSTPQIIMPDGIGWWYYEDEGTSGEVLEHEGTSRDTDDDDAPEWLQDAAARAERQARGEQHDRRKPVKGRNRSKP
jgi:hypothetical protein